MNAFVWVLVCFLASAGIVQAAWWVACYLRRPTQECGIYQIIQLQRDPEQLEAQLRYELFLLRWSAGWRPGVTILLDTGLEKEARDICRNILMGINGVVVCSPNQLLSLIDK